MYLSTYVVQILTCINRAFKNLRIKKVKHTMSFEELKTESIMANMPCLNLCNYCDALLYKQINNVITFIGIFSHFASIDKNCFPKFFSGHRTGCKKFVDTMLLKLQNRHYS